MSARTRPATKPSAAWWKLSVSVGAKTANGRRSARPRKMVAKHAVHAESTTKVVRNTKRRAQRCGNAVRRVGASGSVARKSGSTPAVRHAAAWSELLQSAAENTWTVVSDGGGDVSVENERERGGWVGDGAHSHGRASGRARARGTQPTRRQRRRGRAAQGTRACGGARQQAPCAASGAPVPRPGCWLLTQRSRSFVSLLCFSSFFHSFVVLKVCEKKGERKKR